MAKGTKTGGRKAGTPNKATAEIRTLAQIHGPEMIAELARIAREGQSEAARVAAINALLDRGYGKSAQPIDGDGEGGPIAHRVEFVIVRPKGAGEARAMAEVAIK